MVGSGRGGKGKVKRRRRRRRRYGKTKVLELFRKRPVGAWSLVAEQARDGLREGGSDLALLNVMAQHCLCGFRNVQVMVTESHLHLKSPECF